MEAQWHTVSLRLQVNPPTLFFHLETLKESMNIGLHLMRCLANTQGPKIRVNAVSPPPCLALWLLMFEQIQPGLLLTEWGLGFPQERIEAMKNAAKLKTCVCITSMKNGDGDADCNCGWVKPTVEECADAFVLMAKSSSITGSSLKIGKFSLEEYVLQTKKYEPTVLGCRCGIVRIVWDDKPVGCGRATLGRKDTGKTTLIQAVDVVCTRLRLFAPLGDLNCCQITTRIITIYRKNSTILSPVF